METYYDHYDHYDDHYDHYDHYSHYGHCGHYDHYDHYYDHYDHYHHYNHYDANADILSKFHCIVQESSRADLGDSRGGLKFLRANNDFEGFH